MSDDGKVLSEVQHIRQDIRKIEQHLGRLNGTVKENCTAIAVLKATAITWNSVKFGAVIGGIIALVAVAVNLLT